MAAPSDAALVAFRVLVPCGPAATQADAWSACLAAAGDAGFSVVAQQGGMLVLRPENLRAMLQASASFLGGAAEEARRLLQDSGLVRAGRPNRRRSTAAAAEGLVHVQVLPGDGAGPLVRVSSTDRRNGQDVLGALARRLRCEPPRCDGGGGACDGSLEEFLTPAAPAGGEQREVQDLLRKKSLADWYGGVDVRGSEGSSSSSADGERDLRLRAQSLSDWYKAGRGSDVSALPSFQASEVYALSSAGSDGVPSPEKAAARKTHPPQDGPLHQMLARLEEWEATAAGEGRRGS